MLAMTRRGFLRSAAPLLAAIPLAAIPLVQQIAPLEIGERRLVRAPLPGARPGQFLGLALAKTPFACTFCGRIHGMMLDGVRRLFLTYHDASGICRPLAWMAPITDPGVSGAGYLVLTEELRDRLPVEPLIAWPEGWLPFREEVWDGAAWRSKEQCELLDRDVLTADQTRRLFEVRSGRRSL